MDNNNNIVSTEMVEHQTNTFNNNNNSDENINNGSTFNKDNMNTDNTKNTFKRKNFFSKKKLYIFFVVIFILILTLIILFFVNKNNNKVLMLYTNVDKELKYITTTNKTEPVLLTQSFDEKFNVKYNKNKDKFLFLKNKDLYYVDIKKQTNDKIGVGINEFNFFNDKVTFLTLEGDLYIYDSQKMKIDVNVKDILYSKNDLIIYQKDKNMYYYNVKTKEKKIVVTDFQENKKIFVSSDLNTMVFLGKREDSKTLYKYNISDDKLTTIKNNVENILDVSDDLKNIIYEVKSKETRYFDLFINDTLVNNDKNSPAACYYYYDSFFDTYYYYDENFVIHKVSKEEYDLCNRNANNLALRNQIREDNKSLQYYDVYMYSDGKETLLANDVNDVIYSNVKDKNIVFKKYGISNNEKTNIDKISSIEEYESLIESFKYNLYYSDSSKKDILITSTNEKTNILNFSNNKLYYTIKSDKNENLYAFNINNEKQDTIGNNVIILDYGKKYYDVLFLNNYNTEFKYGDLNSVKDDKITYIDDNVSGGVNNLDNQLYYYQNVDSEHLNGDFIIYDYDKQNKKMIEDVTKVETISKNKFLIFKDYSESSDSISLYFYENDKYTPIEYNVTFYTMVK